MRLLAVLCLLVNVSSGVNLYAAAIDLNVSAPSQQAVASAHPLATNAGLKILALGGNAFDAAVAISAVLAVVEPYSSGLGGGGFWLVHRSHDQHTRMIDGRERAPEKSSRNMYVDKLGDIIPGRSVDGVLSAGIPGQPAALVYLAKHYGKLSLKRSLAPAIKIAENGFVVDDLYLRMATFRLKTLQANPEARTIFLVNNTVPTLGARVVQKDLAHTLRRLANDGHDGFYKGETAQRLVSGVQAAGGLWTLSDLASYQLKVRQPLIFKYRNLQITTAPPPSSGGVALAQILGIFSKLVQKTGSDAERIHLLIEAMRRAYRDRAEFLGDPDYIKVPVAHLLSDKYISRLTKDIKPKQASNSELDLPPVSGKTPVAESQQTTHFSVLDKQNNRVAATLTINYAFGSGVVVPGTGILLNDEMDDFVSKPGVPNAYGLVGADANAIAPGKRPLSSMSPSFIEDDKRLMIVGTPGGSRIITMVLLAILDFERGKTAEQIVTAPRFHHQYLPDEIQHEKNAVQPLVLQALGAYGHKIKELESQYGNMQLIIWDKTANKVSAASDPRGVGTAHVK